MTKQTIEVTVKRGAVSIGLIAAGAALALVLLLGACKDDSASQSGAGLNDAAAESAGELAPVVGGQEGSSGNGVEADHGSEPDDADEPVAPEDADDDLEPTVTPDGGDGCQFCPEDLDELLPVPTPTEEPECNFCPDDPIIVPNW